MALKIQLRRGTASEWTSANPVLMQGEMGVETDTLKVKIGNGSTAWTSLPYFTQGVKGDTGATGATGPQGAKGDKGDIGDTGPANELSVGTVTTGAPGSAATVTISGDAPSQTISFSIPEGLQGIQGIQGEKGDKGDGLPTGGSTGQVVVKTVDGTAWTDLPPSTLADQEDVNITSPQNKQVLKYDGTEWVNATASGGVTVSDTNPADPSQGDGWFYAEDGTQFIRYDDGDSVQWVQPNAVLSSQIEQRYFSPNYVINGGFDIWQRGTTGTGSSGTAFTADRWSQFRASGTSGITVSRQSSGLAGFQFSARVQRDSGNTSGASFYFVQNLEQATSLPLASKTVTFSFFARAGANYSASGSILRATVETRNGSESSYWNVGDGVGTTIQATNNAVLSSSWARYSVTATIPADATQVFPAFRFTPTGTAGANDWFEVTGVQLEEGTTASPFRRNAPSIQAELAACQRYYQRIDSSTQANRFIGSVAYYQGTAAVGLVPLITQMRTIPSVSISASNTFQLLTAQANLTASTVGVNVNDTSPTMIALDVTSTVVTTTAAASLRANNTTNMFIQASSEL